MFRASQNCQTTEASFDCIVPGLIVGACTESGLGRGDGVGIGGWHIPALRAAQLNREARTSLLRWLLRKWVVGYVAPFCASDGLIGMCPRVAAFLCGQYQVPLAELLLSDGILLLHGARKGGGLNLTALARSWGCNVDFDDEMAGHRSKLAGCALTDGV